MTLHERGQADREARERENAERVSANIERGRQDVRRSFVFRFYHDTMIDTGLSGAYHRYGPDSPDPEISPSVEPGPFGGQYHNVKWTFTWEGIDWLAIYGYRTEAWGLNFYVWAKPLRPWDARRFWRRLRYDGLQAFRGEWRVVYSPAQVAEALA